MLMKISKALEGVKLKGGVYEPNLEVTDICSDSRSVRAGSVFVAVTGFSRDGNAYISKALELGAVMIISEKKPDIDCNYALVENSRMALADISRNIFKQPDKELKVIGITGTNGKTSTAYILRHVLEGMGHKCGLIGTNEYITGRQVIRADRTTPESCDIYRYLREMVSCGCEYAVMEVSSHSMELHRVRGIEFDIAVFTNLSHDHLDFHGDEEQYFLAKAKLFSQAERAIINIDDKYGQRLLEIIDSCPVTYSINNDNADIVAKNIRQSPDKVEYEAVSIGMIERVSIMIPGRFTVYNTLAVIGTIVAAQLDPVKSLGHLTSVAGVKGRAEVVPVPENYTVIIDYAVTPDSMENILDTVREFAQNRIIALFGCGGDRDRAKRPLMGEVAATKADVCIVTSDNPRSEEPMSIIDEILPGTKGKKAKVLVEPDRKSAIHLGLKTARDGDVLMLIGKGHETYQEVKGEKIAMDERQIIEEYFKVERF